jgi:hypothetical protein
MQLTLFHSTSSVGDVGGEKLIWLAVQLTGSSSEVGIQFKGEWYLAQELLV